MASWQWGRTMVTIDGCKLLVDHGEAHGVGVTKLSEGKIWSTLTTPTASMAERGLNLAATPHISMSAVTPVPKVSLLRRCAHPCT